MPEEHMLSFWTMVVACLVLIGSLLVQLTPLERAGIYYTPLHVSSSASTRG
jgi:heme/copper-type cytochrome/quinol oxidase subunit 1